MIVFIKIEHWNSECEDSTSLSGVLDRALDWAFSSCILGVLSTMWQYSHSPVIRSHHHDHFSLQSTIIIMSSLYYYVTPHYITCHSITIPSHFIYEPEPSRRGLTLFVLLGFLGSLVWELWSGQTVTTALLCLLSPSPSSLPSPLRCVDWALLSYQCWLLIRLSCLAGRLGWTRLQTRLGRVTPIQLRLWGCRPLSHHHGLPQPHTAPVHWHYHYHQH